MSRHMPGRFPANRWRRSHRPFSYREFRGPRVLTYRQPGSPGMRKSLLCLIAAMCFVGSHATYADEPARVEKSEAVARAREAEPVQRLLAAHPDAAAVAEFNEKYNCWIVEFVVEGRELGMASVSPDGRNILEATFEGDRPAERERSDRVPLAALWEGMRPGSERAAMFWLALLVLLLACCNFDRPWNWRNADLLALLALCPFLAVIWDHTRAAFEGIFLVTLYYLVRALAAAWHVPRSPLSLPAPARSLAVALACLAAYHAEIVRQRGVDDCGIWGSFGAQHLLANGQMPYGQEGYDGGDTYGPLFYALHAPFVRLLPPGYTDAEGFHAVQEALPPGVPYERVSFAAAKVVAALFDGLLLLGLVLLGRRWHGWQLGLAMAVTYAALPYTIDGLNFSSHIVATACSVWALVLVRRPALSGLALGAGIGALFYPVFLLPLWWGYYGGKDRWRFLLAIACVGAVCLWLVLLGEVDLETFLSKTWGNQEGADRYGASRLGFWGQHRELAWLKRPVMAAHVLFCAALAWLPRRKSEYQLAALGAAALLGVQFWKSHMGGHYIEWYMPWLIITLFGSASAARPANGAPSQK